MKKMIAVVLCAAALLLTLVGCGPKTASAGNVYASGGDYYASFGDASSGNVG